MCAYCGRGIQKHLLVGQRRVEVGFRVFQELCMDNYNAITACSNDRCKYEANKERNTGRSFKIIEKYSNWLYERIGTH